MRFQLGILHLDLYIGRERAPRWADEMEGRINRELRFIMVKLEDKVAELTTTLTDIGASVTGISGDVATLVAKIEELQNSNSGELTPEQEIMVNGVLDSARAIKNRVTDLDALTPATEEPS